MGNFNKHSSSYSERSAEIGTLVLTHQAISFSFNQIIHWENCISTGRPNEWPCESCFDSPNHHGTAELPSPTLMILQRDLKEIVAW